MSETVFLKDYEPSPFHIECVELVFKLDPQQTLVHSKMVIKANPDCDEASEQLTLNGEKLKLIDAKHNGGTADYNLHAGGITLDNLKDNDILEFVTEINPQDNKALEGLFLTNNVFCTQCEAEGFRRITYYLDRPDVMADFKVRIEANKNEYPILLSNGNLTNSGDVNETHHFAEFHDPHRKPCYLFALVAGKLDQLQDSFTTCSGKEVELNIFVEPGNREKCHHAMISLKHAMKWDEEHYGREYDLDVFNIVAVSDFVAGAMENKGLNIFNDKYILADSATATDVDYENIDRVVAHEYFHNWTGDRITCKEWFDLCLKEGLTVFREQAYMEAQTDPVTARIDQVILLTDRQFKEDASPLAHPVRPSAYKQVNNFYTATVYEKGSEIFRMLAELVGRKGFRRATDYYFDTYDGQAVTINEFVESVQQTNDIDLSQFKVWYEQSGTPQLTVHSDYNDGKLTIHLKQHTEPTQDQSQKEPLHIPVALGLLNKQGEEIKKTEILNLTEAEQCFTFDDINEEPILSVNRHFSAPVNLEQDVSMDDLAIQALHDSDHYNRWAAMQKLAIQVIHDLMHDHNTHLQLCLETSAAILMAEDMSLRAIAKCLTLPSNQVILAPLQQFDIAKVMQAKVQLKKAIAKHNQTAFKTTYDKLFTEKEYQYCNEDVNKRCLKNVSLLYLAACEDDQATDFVVSQYDKTNNMTDELAVIMAINNIDCAQRETLLENFYDKWQHEHLVVNKWLSCQALTEIDNAFEQVEKLVQHPGFSLQNPNKVYSLLLQFAQYNLLGFHQKDGRAYEFIASKVNEIDSFNPQVASRLVQVFSSWERYDQGRQALMEKVLKQLLEKANLSTNVREPVEKMLL